jgi:undecaprenyl diphosphate synthase
MSQPSSSTLYTPQQLLVLDPARIPKHVAITMDGNRRWAAERLLPSLSGHWAGAENLTHVVRAATDLGIKVLTVYAFSTENWNRSKEEVDGLMDLFNVYLVEQREQMIQEGVRLDTIGDISKFSPQLVETIQESKEMTAGGEKIDLVLALNYGGRDDIRRALAVLTEEYASRKLSLDELTEECISKHLDTAKWPDPDLYIRTGGELRLSNFLLWQLSYSEIYVTDVNWPDFTAPNLYKAVLEYQQRKRRFGA